MRRGAAGLLIAVAMMLAAPALAADSDKPADRVYITAEHLTADTAGRWAEFSGKVNARQGATVITARRLKVFYASREAGSDTGQGMGQIERIEAGGDVVIHFDQRVAEADEARYAVADRVLVLTGDPARVTENENTVTGGRIVMNRDENRIIVEKPAGGSVEAVFTTRDQGLQ
ncbi:MAG: LptA/OstA family protein [Desulfobacterales bacterium]|jgi:lipopolysaccharide export system protein LptA|nr:LptA/OstA family protein [Desulfobacteraceae bacterium]MDD3992064.1 LptA/OstA family protein [Desulfobacteraceae bacterium]MDY0311355.1 LptA/OstA family protein [Desulfobacterales bacterium]